MLRLGLVFVLVLGLRLLLVIVFGLGLDMGNQPSYLGSVKIPIASLEAVANEWRVGEYEFALHREAFTTLLSNGGLSLPVSASKVFDIYAIPTKPLNQVY